MISTITISHHIRDSFLVVIKIGEVYCHYRKAANDVDRDLPLRHRYRKTKASRKWEQENPHRAGYLKLRRTAFSFVNPEPGSKAEAHINANRADYMKDLKNLEQLLKKGAV